MNRINKDQADKATPDPGVSRQPEGDNVPKNRARARHAKERLPEDAPYFMRPTICRAGVNPGAEIIRYGRCKPDILSLAQGESDQPTPSFITQAVSRALEKGYTGYGPVLGREELREGLSSYYRRIYGLEVQPERIAITISGSAALHIALRLLIEEDDEVVCVTPIWKNLLGSVGLRQARVHEVTLDKSGDQWHLDLEKLFDAVTPDTRALLINSPNNPTGWTIEAPQIAEIMSFARQRGLWVISDEVYGRLDHKRLAAPSFLSEATPDDLLIVVNSFSKNWAMTGWRLGWIIAPTPVIEKLYTVILYENMGAANFLQFGALAALEDGEEFIANFKQLCLNNLKRVNSRLERIPGINPAQPRAGFYSFFQVEGEDDCMRLARRLIDEQSLLLGPGCSFGSSTKGYIRLCFAVTPEKLEEGLNRLESGLGLLKKNLPEEGR